MRSKVLSPPPGLDLFNPYPMFGNEGGWPRGFPLDQILNKTTYAPTHVEDVTAKNNFYVHQSLADHDPDYDAIYRSTFAGLSLLRCALQRFAMYFLLRPHCCACTVQPQVGVSNQTCRSKTRRKKSRARRWGEGGKHKNQRSQRQANKRKWWWGVCHPG